MAKITRTVVAFTLAMFMACDEGGTSLPLDLGVETAPDVLTSDEATVEAEPEVLADETPQDISQEEMVFEDITPDKVPPEVVKTEPANEQTGVPIPFVIKVTFSEAIRFKETVDASTFQVTDMNGQAVKGDFSYDAATFTVTWTPKAGTVFLLASPYRVTLTTTIQDKAGNHLKDYYSFSFSTSLPPKYEEDYKPLAAKYAPVIFQATAKTAPQFDYPTSYDFDGQWAAKAKEAAIKKATEIPAWVYWDVVETKTHYFIRYAFYYPLHMGETGGSDAFSNDLSGATVVVAKRPVEAPVAVETYFGRKDVEEIVSFITKESGLVPQDGSPDAFLFDALMTQEELFPSNRYMAYLTASSHQSCLWNWYPPYDPTSQRCRLNDGIKATLSVVKYTYSDGTATALKKGASGFPATAEGVSYGLRSLMNEWWVRRDHVGEDSIFSATFTYEAPEGHAGSGMTLPQT
ncbi:MAG: Ig-like domain-containing protein, partial [Syntrophales bacterium]|nr:Ig-like domain-containing protein [Syntrophales bacterium]